MENPGRTEGMKPVWDTPSSNLKEIYYQGRIDRFMQLVESLNPGVNLKEIQRRTASVSKEASQKVTGGKSQRSVRLNGAVKETTPPVHALKNDTIARDSTFTLEAQVKQLASSQLNKIGAEPSKVAESWAAAALESDSDLPKVSTSRKSSLALSATESEKKHGRKIKEVKKGETGKEKVEIEKKEKEKNTLISGENNRIAQNIEAISVKKVQEKVPVETKRGEGKKPQPKKITWVDLDAPGDPPGPPVLLSGEKSRELPESKKRKLPEAFEAPETPRPRKKRGGKREKEKQKKKLQREAQGRSTSTLPVQLRRDKSVQSTVPSCKFWMEGKCSKGSACEFSHSGTPKTRGELCKFATTDSCLKEQKDCPFSHDLKNFPCKFFHLSAQELGFSNPNQTPNQTPNQNPNQTPGLNPNSSPSFTPNGPKRAFGCREGSGCPFSHEPITEQEREALKKRVASWQNQERTAGAIPLAGSPGFAVGKGGVPFPLFKSASANQGTPPGSFGGGTGVPLFRSASANQGMPPGGSSGSTIGILTPRSGGESVGARWQPEIGQPVEERGMLISPEVKFGQRGDLCGHGFSQGSLNGEKKGVSETGQKMGKVAFWSPVSGFGAQANEPGQNFSLDSHVVRKPREIGRDWQQLSSKGPQWTAGIPRLAHPSVPVPGPESHPGSLHFVSPQPQRPAPWENPQRTEELNFRGNVPGQVFEIRPTVFSASTEEPSTSSGKSPEDFEKPKGDLFSRVFGIP